MSSRYFAPSRPPPKAAIHRTPLYFETFLDNEVTLQTESRTQEYTVTPINLINRVAKKVTVEVKWVTYSTNVRSFVCYPLGAYFYCQVNETFHYLRDGVEMEPTGGVGIDILDNAPGVSHSYRIVEYITADCPSCDPVQCPGGCTDPQWGDPSGQLTGKISVWAGSNIPGDVVIEDVAPGNVYGFVADFPVENYDVVINGEVVDIHEYFYEWETRGLDLVAYLPKGFRIREGDELKMVVKSQLEDTQIYGFIIPKFVWLIE
jgi:hypothetical protein